MHNRDNDSAVNFESSWVDSRLLSRGMRKGEHSSKSEPKGVCRIRNWSHYNAGLIARGNITMWVNEDERMALASCTTRQHGYSKRRIWRKDHLALDIRTDQIRAALMTHQYVDDASALPDLLDQIPADVPIDIVGGDGAYDSRQSHAVMAARDAQAAIPPREGAVPWPQNIPGAGWRNEAIKAIATWGRAQRK